MSEAIAISDAIEGHDAQAFDHRAELRGRVLDRRYHLGARIGAGGTGVVFGARRLGDDEPVAIKVLRRRYVDHPDLARRLRREAEVTRQVIHPGLVRILDEGTLEDGSPYLVMPRLRGESLASLLRRQGPLAPQACCALTIRVAAILHAVHVAGYTHRDIKPEHILLETGNSGDLRVWLLDFGVCSSPSAPADERMREQGRVFGTPSYASPEQASGMSQVDGRADLFSLGIVLFEALTGVLPFEADSITALLLRIIREDAPRLRSRLPRVDPALDLLVAQLLARDPGRRPASARALARALTPMVEDRRAAERRLAASLRTPLTRHAGAAEVQARTAA